MGGALIQIVSWTKEPAVIWTCDSGSCRSEGRRHAPGRNPALGWAAIVSPKEVQNHVSARIRCNKFSSTLNERVRNERPPRPAPRKLLVDNSFVAFGRTIASWHYISKLLNSRVDIGRFGWAHIPQQQQFFSSIGWPVPILI